MDDGRTAGVLARTARAEGGALGAAVRAGWARRGAGGVSLALGAAALTVFLQYAQHQDWGGFVRVLGTVRAADPLWLALLRTPLSLCVPAPDLPVWGALAQVLVVFGAAQLCLGGAPTLLLAYAATLAGTLYARLGIALGPAHPAGLPSREALTADTGPSAAVVALACCVALRCGARWTAGLVVAAMCLEVLVKDNLAGREHLVALGAAALLCARPSPGPRAPRTPPAAGPATAPATAPGTHLPAGTPGPGAPPMTSWKRRAQRCQFRSWW